MKKEEGQGKDGGRRDMERVGKGSEKDGGSVEMDGDGDGDGDGLLSGLGKVKLGKGWGMLLGSRDGERVR